MWLAVLLCCASGGMPRDVDPELMASIIKAIKNGNVEGAFSKTNVPADSPAEEFESDDVSTEEEDSDRVRLLDNSAHHENFLACIGSKIMPNTFQSVHLYWKFQEH